MKKLIIIISILIFRSTAILSQPFSSICKNISTLDKAIADLDNERISSFTYNNTTYKKIKKLVPNELMPLFNSPNLTNNEIITRLDCINTTEAITWLEWYFVLRIQELERVFEDTQTYPSSHDTPSRLKEIQRLIHSRTEEVMGREFSLYGFTETSNKWIKAVYLEHQNDFLSFYNQDRDLTGAFRFELATDKLKLRGISTFIESWKNWNSRNWYSYQGIFVGGEGYTPYLRDTTIFNTVNSFDPQDRPYASFKYFGWAKYRISRLGKVRFNTQIKIGKIGTAAGEKIQSAIHRDLTIGSVKPYGWGAQIASGGRIAFSFEALGEFLITKNTKKNFIIPSILAEGTYGHDKTSLSLGINLSNKNLKERSGWNVSFLNMRNGYVLWNIKGYIRYVFHNSMLEGYGILKQTPDENPLSPQDLYVLTRGRNNSADQINEYVYGTEISLNLSFKYFNIIFKQSYWSPEFDLPVNYIEYPFADDGKPGSHNKSPWNHTGTIGLVFKI